MRGAKIMAIEKNSIFLTKKFFNFVFLAFVCVACGKSDEIFIVAPDNASNESIYIIQDVLEKNGVNSSVGVVPSKGPVDDYWLTGKDLLVYLRISHLPMSRGEKAVEICGNIQHLSVDPGQFGLTLQQWVPLVGASRYKEIHSIILKELPKQGFEVRQAPVLCSNQARRMAKSD